MKRKLFTGSLCLFLLLFAGFACKKSIDQTPPDTVPAPPVVNTQKTDTTPAVQPVPYPQTTPLTCQYAPDYGDSIIYAQPVSGNNSYIVSPVNNIGVKGSYFAWPGGMVINSGTGAINMTKSETGGRFTVGFVKEGTTDTCTSQIILAGAAYMDSVYVMEVSDTTAHPYFNANPYGPPVCESGSGPGGPGCKFDIYNTAKNQHIEVDEKTGFINLKKSLKDHMFGIIPLNGTTVTTTIYYKLNDNSNNAVQSLQVKMMYYNKVSDIPAGLIGTITGKLLNILGDLLIGTQSSPKPPLIIVTRYRT